MTPLGILFVVALLIAVVTRRGFVRLLAFGGALPIGVIANVAGQPLPTFYTLGAGALVVVGIRMMTERAADRPTGVRRPGALALVLFTAWSVFVTLVAPTIFYGVPVLVSRGGIDEQFLDPGTLAYSVSNLAQAAYLVIALGVVFFLARSPSATPRLLGVTLAVVTLISFWRFFFVTYGLPFPDGFFDNSTAVRIIETTPNGDPRFRGIFSEPSGLAAASLTAIVYFLVQIGKERGWLRFGMIVVLGMAAFNAIVSTSGTFVAAGLLMFGVVVIAAVWGFIVNGTRVSPIVLAVGVGVIGLSAFFIPALVDLINSVVNVKISSSSYGSRTGVDLFSYMLTLQTWGFGVGLGSNRPSSFLAMLFSCTGVIGTVLFAVALARLSAAAWKRPEYRATVWALISVLVCKVVSGPNLSDPAALMWICCGVLARAAWTPSSSADDVLAASDRYLPREAIAPVGGSVSGTSRGRF